MTASAREYRVQVYAHDDVAIAFTLGLADLAAPPVVTGHIARPLQGATEMRPFRLRALDRAGALTAALAASGRWVALGRLIDIAYRDLPAGSWVTYGTGRISDIAEQGGPGEYDIEVSDESWRARKAAAVLAGNTTRLWPTGPAAPWRGFPGALTAAGARMESSGTRHRIRLRAGPSNASYSFGIGVQPNLVRWLDGQKRDVLVQGPNPAGGEFGPVRLRYGGADYEVVSFGRSLNDVDALSTLREPTKIGTGAAHQVEVTVWVYSSTTPPATGTAYLHAPDAPPGGGLVLHLGMASPDHPWGTAAGGIHPATLTRRVWNAIGLRYDSDALAVLEADRGYPLLHPGVTEPVEDVERWMQDEVWGPLLLMAHRAPDGRRRLVDMRMPALTAAQADALPVVDASNARPHSWRLTGRDAVNHIVWSYLHHDIWTSAPTRQDGLAVEERTAEPITDDASIAALGTRSLSLKLHAAVEPTQEPERIGMTGTWYGLVPVLSRELLDIYRDGAWTLTGEVAGTLAATLAEGDLAILDAASLKLPNPASGARTDLRLARALSITRHPTHAEVEWLDLGPSAAPLTAPTISVVQDAADPDAVLVTVGSVPPDGLCEVQAAFTPTLAPPAEWPLRRIVGAGVHVFRGAPGDGYVQARARTIYVPGSA
jgi:hypothetical protein